MMFNLHEWITRKTGYVHCPGSPGDSSKFGVTQRRYSKWLRDHSLPVRSVRDMTLEEAYTFYYERSDSKIGA